MSDDTSDNAWNTPDGKPPADWVEQVLAETLPTPDRLPVTVARLTAELEAERKLADALANALGTAAPFLAASVHARHPSIKAVINRWREARGR